MSDTVRSDDPTPDPAARFPFLGPPQQPGELGRLGPYRVLAVLGRGGMGVVFRAEDAKLRRHVALKVMLPAVADSPAARERFLREARAQAAVEHDHIIPIFQVEDAGTPYIAMPLLAGETLSAYLRRTPRPPLADALRIARQAADGLAAAHAKGLVHRDIKPANVWLEGDRRRVKILDFGLARGVTRGADGVADPTRTGAVVGTPAYMAPEQAAGRAVDHRADLWSLGVVLYQMTTGSLPFDGADVFALLTALAIQVPTPPTELNSELPPAVGELILRLLSKDPAGRPASAAAVAAELRALEATRPAEPAPAETPWAALAEGPTERLSATRTPARPAADAPRTRLAGPWVWPLLALLVFGGGGAILYALVRPAGRERPEADGKPAVKPAAGKPSVAHVPGSSRPTAAELDFYREVHGATPDRLRAWADALPAGFRPTWVSARTGVTEPLFDAVAVPFPKPADWRLRITPTQRETEADYEAMKEDGYRPGYFCGYGTNPPGDARVWVKDGDTWYHWYSADAKVIAGKLDEQAKAGSLPVSLTFTSDPSWEGYYVCFAGRSGVPFEYALDLSPAELAGRVATARAKGWRPHLVAMHQNRTPHRYAAVFAANVPPVEWEFTPDLSLADYERELADRAKRRVRPQCVDSFVGDGGAVRYSVVWAADDPPRVALGLTEARLKAWAEKLPAGVVPVALLPRAGTVAEPVYDAIARAVPGLTGATVAVVAADEDQVTCDSLADAGHRPLARAVVAGPGGGGVRHAHVWGRPSDGRPYGTWHTAAAVARSLAGARDAGLWPVSYQAAGTPDEPELTVVLAENPAGLAWETRDDLSADALAKAVAEYRAKGWRPRLVSADHARTPPGYRAVFAENRPAVAWEFSPALGQAEYEASAAERAANGVYPVSLTSAVVGGAVRLTVVWAACVPTAVGR